MGVYEDVLPEKSENGEKMKKHREHKAWKHRERGDVLCNFDGTLQSRSKDILEDVDQGLRASEQMQDRQDRSEVAEMIENESSCGV